VFHHIPKCGGTSVRKALEKWFHIVFDYLPDPDNHPEAAQRYVEQRLDISRLKGRDLLCGHFETKGVYLQDRYPEILQNPNRFRVFTFLRDPLQHRISHYYHVKSVRNWPTLTLENWLWRKNLIASTLPCTEADYKQVLDRYFFVGITESLQESMDRLALLLHKKPVDVPKSNVMQRDEEQEAITPLMHRRFRADNELDYRIYEYVLERFHGGTRIGAYGFLPHIMRTSANHSAASHD
jgi:hypothetical protein